MNNQHVDRPRIVIGADHTGVKEKSALVAHLTAQQYVVKDVGSFDPDAPDDYPDFAAAVAKEVSVAPTTTIGILICGTGVGVCIAANKFKGIRAALVYDHKVADLAVRHDNANILCLGARTTPVKEMTLIVDAFLNAQFEGGRHSRRVNKVNQFDDLK